MKRAIWALLFAVLTGSAGSVVCVDSAAADQKFFLASIFSLEANAKKELIPSNHRYMSVFVLNGCWCDVTISYFKSESDGPLIVKIAQRGVAQIDAFSTLSATADKVGDVAVVAFYTDK